LPCWSDAEEGATAETATPTTGTPFPGDGSDSGGPETGADEVGASSGESSTGTTGPEVQAEPVIVGMSLTPGPGTPGSCVLKSAGPVTVTVQVEGAEEVWITVDDGEAVALEPVGDDQRSSSARSPCSVSRGTGRIRCRRSRRAASW
jgi:hypothetical protein